MKAQWGFVTWTYLHTLAASIPENAYPALKTDLLAHIKAICSCLPCPICAKHASEYVQNLQLSHIPTKKALGDVLCAFHNTVNHRTQKKIFPSSQLGIYSQLNLNYVYRMFAVEMAKPGDARLMTSSMVRRMVMQRLARWMASLPRETYKIGPYPKPGPRAGGDPHAGNVSVQNGKSGGGGEGDEGDLVHA